jgi:DNA mismatch repair ATPase MutS
MGGKSTFIRQVAICCLLAHVGIPVPAKSLKLSILSGIFTRVGASDMQIKGISTFFAEMIETANMLRSSDENSLLLVDELGRGTSTFEGLSIARSTLEYILTHKRSFCLFATHFHKLSGDGMSLEGLRNLYVSSHHRNGNIVFDYKVLPGKTDKSFGIDIIKNLKFPKEIIQTAYQIERKIENQNLL